MNSRFFLFASAFLAIHSTCAALPADFDKQVAALRAVGKEGAGNPAATTAFQAISGADAAAILPLLRAMESSGPLARNWLRSAVEVIVERELKAKKTLPSSDLKAFLLDTKQAPEARRFAFDLLSKIDPSTARNLIPGFLNDPSTELRRDAVAALITTGKSQLEKADKTAATSTYKQALDAARDIDQIEEIAKQLSEKLGAEVDLPRHFGFLTHWHVIGPFDNTGRAGFDTVFDPEKEIKLDARYKGKGDQEIAWQPFASAHEHGKVDLNAPFGLLKEVTGYAYTEYNAAEARPAELRLGCKNAWKIWFNGELIFGRDEYHRGQRIDQYKMPVQLKAGKNTLLVKACQNEQTQDWTVEWEFQLRVCDSTGTAILATDRPPTPKKEAPKRRGGDDAAKK